ncbi:hypothetical protein NEOLI_000587 [Neolecta irregularis DAH-3]|uniref:Uncharacterized protein n=1 Tax=Neolecta irregularis (strain DAH-3) TaxID=1198029 RepID=A0A1U7LRC8_NEOID|nr:hypothetical protein NEOLI_000587 [Neolecta irregularis DAH-3]|eukprot:OLL25133.1 hypothetical protein NEOLI_000587 [Neolecta irregularis DAH-3]
MSWKNWLAPVRTPDRPAALSGSRYHYQSASSSEQRYYTSPPGHNTEQVRKLDNEDETIELLPEMPLAIPKNPPFGLYDGTESIVGYPAQAKPRCRSISNELVIPQVELSPFLVSQNTITTTRHLGRRNLFGIASRHPPQAFVVTSSEATTWPVVHEPDTWNITPDSIVPESRVSDSSRQAKTSSPSLGVNSSGYLDIISSRTHLSTYVPQVSEEQDTTLATPQLLDFVRNLHPADQGYINFCQGQTPAQYSKENSSEPLRGYIVDGVQLLQLNIHDYGTEKHHLQRTNMSLYSNKSSRDSESLFGAYAIPVELPYLDTFISSFSRTRFTPWKDVMPEKEMNDFRAYGQNIFPPWNKLPRYTTLEDLKSNTKKRGWAISTKNDIWSIFTDIFIGAEGSTLSSYITLEIFRDYIQLNALIISAIIYHHEDKRSKKVADILSLNLQDIFGGGAAFLSVMLCICFILLWKFRRMRKSDPGAATDIEGFEVNPWLLQQKKTRLAGMFTIFFLTTLYLPVSKLAIDAIVWERSFWPTWDSDRAIADPEHYYGFDQVCYQSSNRIYDPNWAWAIVSLAIIAVVSITISFPIYLRALILRNVPRVDPFNEAGEVRTDHLAEYARLLSVDRSPYNILYAGYHYQWAEFKIYVLFMKLIYILLIDVVTVNNCLFHHSNPRTIATISSSLQILFMTILFIGHFGMDGALRRLKISDPSIYKALLFEKDAEPLRIGVKTGICCNYGRLSFAYHLIAPKSLGLLTISIIIFILIGYFAISGAEFFHKFVKRWLNHIEVSVDAIFSSKLSFSRQIKRRIWMDSWTTILLAKMETSMSPDQVVAFSQSSSHPPYLLQFGQTVAERHVENLKITRKIGLNAYKGALEELNEETIYIRRKIYNELVGPDCFYFPERPIAVALLTLVVYVTPFPFTVVFVYDEIEVNEHCEIIRRKKVRVMLRALDVSAILAMKLREQRVRVFGDHLSTIIEETHAGILCGYVSARCIFITTQEKFTGPRSVKYVQGIFTIRKNRDSLWRREANMNSGFECFIMYTHKEPGGCLPKKSIRRSTIGASLIGVTSDFRLTSALEKLFKDNENTLDGGILEWQGTLKSYRTFYREEALAKETTLSYGFQISVFNESTIQYQLLKPLLAVTEINSNVIDLPAYARTELIYLYERMRVSNHTRLHQFWYLFWDDLWRRNHEDIKGFKTYEVDLSPLSPTSICYWLMSRATLEAFLHKRGIYLRAEAIVYGHGKVGARFGSLLSEIGSDKIRSPFHRKEGLYRDDLEMESPSASETEARLAKLSPVDRELIEARGEERRLDQIDEFPADRENQDGDQDEELYF